MLLSIAPWQYKLILCVALFMPKLRVRRPKNKPAKKQRVIEHDVPADVDPWNASGAAAENPIAEQSEDPWKYVLEDNPWAETCSPQSSVQQDPWCDEVGESLQSSVPSPQRKQRVSIDTGSRLLAESTLKTHSTSYEVSAMHPDKIRYRWAQKCPRGNCQLEGCAPRALHLKALQDLCHDFWSITSEERVHLLQVTYGDGTGKCREYYIGSSRVCFCNFCKKLGCSQNTMRKYIAGQPDMRKKGVGGGATWGSQQREANATLKCDHFFRELHQSVAECMPEDDEAAVEDPWDQDSCSKLLFYYY